MSQPFGPIIMVCNDRSGNGGVRRALPEVEQELRKRGLEYELRHTEGPGHAVELTRTALKDGYRFVVAVGGDGTVHEVVNGMIENDVPINPDAVFGVVAAGTGSDFIKTFGLPKTPQAAVLHLDGPESFPIDIGKITFGESGSEQVRYFANIAEAGLGAAVAERATRLPRWLGPTVYFFALWLTIRGYRIGNVKIDLVDRTYEGPMGTLAVANGQFFGGGMKVAPKAAPTDGLLDVLIFAARKRESIAIMPKMFKGTHIPHPDIKEFKRVRLSLESDRPLQIEADGEILGFSPARFEILRDALRIKV